MRVLKEQPAALIIFVLRCLFFSHMYLLQEMFQTESGKKRQRTHIALIVTGTPALRKYAYKSVITWQCHSQKFNLHPNKPFMKYVWIKCILVLTQLTWFCHHSQLVKLKIPKPCIHIMVSLSLHKLMLSQSYSMHNLKLILTWLLAHWDHLWAAGDSLQSLK